MTSAKRGYHHGDLRNALVSAALELAAADGPDAVTIRAAARATGVTPTAVYRHFADRDQLLSAVKQHAVQRVPNAVRNALPANALLSWSDLCAVAREYVHFAATEPGLFRTMCEPATSDGWPTGKFGDSDGGVDMVAWLSVHGLATLLAGPLMCWPQNRKDELVARVLANLEHGLWT